MRELIDFHAILAWMVEKWRTSLLAIILMVASFGLGGAIEKKTIVDDCKFMGSFRDGTQAYNCNLRAR